ncbi:head-tail connector protein [Hymenobacter sp. BT491]|uniref:head-tail connector protein n=1 Tax=Hymenobacter sp. BT491 TaxID=2766779 RepID=UPI001653CB52|nr:head-tail connector protein [Hymenobacter sp. BT491]MBC6988938.1 phage gp6-like head-tail connector protein [Hymenobacter sp. BT491]
MPTTVVLPSSSAPLPVSLELARQHLRLDGTGEDALLTHYLKAACGLCEQYCGRLFRSATVKATFRLDEDYVLDPLAGSPTAVEGFLTDVADLPTLSSYLEEYRKGISINRELPWGVALASQTYTVTYPVTVPEDAVPAEVAQAILKLTSDLYENRETSSLGNLSHELSVGYRVLLAPYRLTNVLN